MELAFVASTSSLTAYDYDLRPFEFEHRSPRTGPGNELGCEFPHPSRTAETRVCSRCPKAPRCLAADC